MRILIVILSLVMACLIIFWQSDSQILFWQESSESSKYEILKANDQSASAINAAQAASKETSRGVEYDVQGSQFYEEAFTPNPAAIASMRQARLEGDPRAPKLGEYHEREIPTKEELGDHEQYLEYERRQQKRVYRAYVDASKIKTTQLRSMIEKGKVEGISAEEIAFAEDKIRGIEEMAIKLQQDYPDIMEDSYQPPADWLIENLGQNDDSNKTDKSTPKID